MRQGWAPALTIINSPLTISFLLRLIVKRFSSLTGSLEHWDRTVRIALKRGSVPSEQSLHHRNGARSY